VPFELLSPSAALELVTMLDGPGTTVVKRVTVVVLSENVCDLVRSGAVGPVAPVEFPCGGEYLNENEVEVAASPCGRLIDVAERVCRTAGVPLDSLKAAVLEVTSSIEIVTLLIEADESNGWCSRNVEPPLDVEYEGVRTDTSAVLAFEIRGRGPAIEGVA